MGLAVRDAIGRVHGDYGLACCSISFTGAGGTRFPGPLGAGGEGGSSGKGRGGGSGLTGAFPAVKYLNAYTGTVLLRCRKDSYRLLCSALPFVRQLESRGQRYPCCLRTLHVGGQSQRLGCPRGRPRSLIEPSRPAGGKTPPYCCVVTDPPSVSLT